MSNPAELVVLRDRDGNIVVPQILRSEVKLHKQELIDAGKFQSIVIAVVRDGSDKIIGQLRGPNQSEPGHWDNVSGAMRPGETPEVAAAREIGEELGCEVTGLRIHRQGVNSYGRYCFLLSAVAAEAPRVGAPDEIDEVVARTTDEWRTLADQGRLFVNDFFEDVAATA